MSEDVDKILKRYLADRDYHEELREETQKRNEAIQHVTAIAQSFVTQKINLQTFCSQLIESFKITGERWGAQGNAFTIPLAKLFKYHDEHAPIAENRLRELLTDISVENLGRKIEQWHDFLLEERSRLRQEGKASGVIVEAGRSALMMSLFTFWLHPEQQPLVFHHFVRSGLALLVKKHGFTPPRPLHIVADAVVITTNDDYQAVRQAIQKLGALHTNNIYSTYGSEYFFYWLQEYETKGKGEKIIHDSSEDVSLPARAEQAPTIKNEPLIPTPEPLLTNLIREVQRHILVEEAVVRRIYHALLAGHVILAGPPGTGKTELARLIPEILWKNAEDGTSPTAYTTRLVTATDEWSVRTLISGIAPVSKNGSVAYKVQYGHLTSTILKNWFLQRDHPEAWTTALRAPVTASSGIERDTQQTFRGQWLVIDEFNRAPIDLALGDALTALGGNDVLRVMTEDGSMELPIPKDFRLIGTLNSFDRNYLNQISEALKRRFSFVEILPPGRNLREEEQAMVLYKALKQVDHLRQANNSENETFPWDTLAVEADLDGPYIITWPDEAHPFREAFEMAWRVFEVIRVYRQLGTAQAISLIQHLLIAGILQGYSTREQWIGQALDAALCDTIADQLQVLLPDEIDALLLFLTSERATFAASYHRLLAGLLDRPQRLSGQLLALGSVSDEQGEAYLSDEEIEICAHSSPPMVAEAKLHAIFHLDAPMYRLPRFVRRLRTFKAERGL